MSQHFTRDEISHLGLLARIELSDAEVERLTKDLNVINDAIAKVSEVASDDVYPTSHPLPLENVFREDVPATLSAFEFDVNGVGTKMDAVPFAGDLLQHGAALAGGPKTEAGQFVAPQILSEG